MASFSFSIKATGLSGSRTLSSHCCFLPSYGPSCSAPNWPILQLAAMCSMYLCIYPFINVMLERCTYLSPRKTLLLYLVLDFSTKFVQTTHHYTFKFSLNTQYKNRIFFMIFTSKVIDQKRQFVSIIVLTLHCSNNLS